MWNDFESKESIFWVANGSPIWKKTVGLPKLDDNDKSDIESRTYTIRALFDPTRWISPCSTALLQDVNSTAAVNLPSTLRTAIFPVQR